MISRHLRRGLIYFAFLTVIAFGTQLSEAQTTSFTYQGNLNLTNGPANGSYDLEFALYAFPTGGTSLSAGFIDALNIVNGHFSVDLPFGEFFTGASRYIEIRVRPAGVGQFTVLTPRQLVLSAPYAIKSINATSANSLNCTNCVTAAQITSVNGGVVTGTIPVASVPAGSGHYIRNGIAPQASSNFNISGSAQIGGELTANFATIFGNTAFIPFSVSSNSGAVARFKSQSSFASIVVDGANGEAALTLARKGDDKWFVQSKASNAFHIAESGNGVRFAIEPTTGNVGIGTAAPNHRLQVNGNISAGVVNAPDIPGINNLLIENDTGNNLNSFRLDGSADFLYMIARSGAGSTQGAGLVFRTAPAGGGELTRMQINPSGTVEVRVLGTGGTIDLCRNPSLEISTCSSSLKYKNNVQTYNGGIDVARKLRPISFDWKDGGSHDLGFAAEEVAAIDPRLVTFNENGEVEGVKYDRISVVLINTVKEQQEKIERLEQELKEIKMILQRDTKAVSKGVRK